MTTSSSDSYNELLMNQRSKLISEQQKIKKELQKSQLQADGLEHDLQIAQQAFSFAESSIIGRTKRLATLFGGMLKSDDELVEKIQALIKSTEEDEEKAENLRQQIEEYNLAQSQDDCQVDEVRNELKIQNEKIAEKQAEHQAHCLLLEDANKKILEAQRRKSDVFAHYQPICQMLNAKITDPDFFEILHQKATGMDNKTRRAFQDLADLIHEDDINFDKFDINRFFDSVCYYYEKLIRRDMQQKQMNKEVNEKLAKTKNEISSKKKKMKSLCAFINTTKSQIEKHQNDISSRLSEIQNQERRNIQAAYEMSYQLKAKSTNKITVDKMIEYECNKIIETACQLKQAKFDRERRKKKSELQLIKGINVLENAADTISVANRRILHHIKPVSI